MNVAIKSCESYYIKAIFKRDSKGNDLPPEESIISNFILLPKEIIKYKNTIEVKVIFKKKNKEIEMVLSILDFVSVINFKKSINRIDATLKFIGRDDDLEIIKCMVTEDESNIYKKGIEYIGLTNINNKWMYIDKDNDGDNEYISVSKNVIMDHKFGNEKINKSELLKLNKYLFNFNNDYIVYTVLAGITNCFMNSRIRKIKSLKEKTPIIFYCGESGSGKSETVENILVPIFGGYSCIKGTKASEIKEFAFLKQLSETNLFPIIVEEFKTHKMTKFRIDLISNVIRSLYNNHTIVRGKPDQTYIEYEIVAPLVIIGETQIDETAAKDRILKTEFSKQNFNKQYENSINKLKECEDYLVKLGATLLESILNISDDEIKSDYKYYKDKLENENMPTRVKNSIIISTVSYKLLRNIFESNGIETKSLDNVFEIIKQSQIIFNLNGETKNKSVAENTFELIGRMIDSEYLQENVDYCIRDSNICFRLMSMYDKVTKYIRDYNIKGEYYESVSSFREQAMKSEYFFKNLHIRNDWEGMKNKQQRCHLFGLKELSKLDFSIADEYSEKNETTDEINKNDLPIDNTDIPLPETSEQDTNKIDYKPPKNINEIGIPKFKSMPGSDFKKFTVGLNTLIKGKIIVANENIDINCNDLKKFKGLIFLDINNKVCIPGIFDLSIKEILEQNFYWHGLKRFNIGDDYMSIMKKLQERSIEITERED